MNKTIVNRTNVTFDYVYTPVQGPPQTYKIGPGAELASGQLPTCVLTALHTHNLKHGNSYPGKIAGATIKDETCPVMAERPEHATCECGAQFAGVPHSEWCPMYHRSKL